MMLTVPAQCIVALRKAVKVSATICRIFFLLPQSKLGQILASDSTYRLACSSLKRTWMDKSVHRNNL